MATIAQLRKLLISTPSLQGWYDKTKRRRRRRKTKAESESEEEDTPKQKRGKKASDDDDDSEEEPKKKKKPTAKGKRRFIKKCRLSPQLAKVMGEENMARHEVVKKMWSIIKEKQLYDPKNKQFAICNADLLPVFKVKRFRTFGTMKYLETHFFEEDCIEIQSN
ncbi:Upstream activation factor subunit spp27 [Folsomia candida]|uniref:Upstream activation factor subunit spp27 n=1 Tax=Folsomia candida TaxID=158441 RepID=A0A226CZL0_FOLCA|nr:Upstream activation factor subunit spp27 [Folsomia candida]